MYTYFLIPIFYLLYQLLWGYYCQFFILVALYPTISFLTFFGVHFRLSHTLYFTFTCFLAVAYPDISFFAFFGVRTFSYITYYGFSTLLFARNVPRYFIFYISLGTQLLVHHLLLLRRTPLRPKRTPIFHFCHFSGYNPPPHHPHSSTHHAQKHTLEVFRPRVCFL